MAIKSNAVIVGAWDSTGNVYSIDVRGSGAGQLVFDRRTASAACRDEAERMGWKQRFGDKAAKSCDPKTGKPQPASVKYEGIRQLVEHYASGTEQWRLGFAAGERESGGLLARAVLEYQTAKNEAKGKPAPTAEQVGAYLKEKSAKDRANLGMSPGIRPIMERLRAEQVEDVDTDEALADFDMDEVDGEIAELMSKE